jgi:hypothetical protein
MCSFSCPHYDMEKDFCLKLRTDCVPGRPGCVLCQNSVFAVPVEQRIREKAEAKERKRAEERAREKG